MGRRLKGYVPIHGEEGTEWYGPDDEVPDEVAEQIGDHAWEDTDVEDDELGDDDQAEREAAEAAEREQAEKVRAVAEAAGGPPPMNGPGSGADAWGMYAAALEVQVPAEAKREEIRTAIAEAGYPVD